MTTAPAGLTRDELQRRVAEHAWYHSVPLPHGVVTPGVNASARALSRLRLPERLDGRTVLDVGAWDGFYSFEAERRGAARVVASDSYSWSGEGWGTKAGFELCREVLGSRVEDADVDVMDLRPETVGTFDLVLLLGVLYHLRDPITALERVASVCTGTLVVETEVALPWLPFPAARVFPGRELNDDDTNWYAYNPAALDGMLASAGFSRRRVVWRTSLPRRLARAVRSGGTDRAGLATAFRSQRIVVHAER
jgi:tRNA (mo5U34)-methyltransferase